MWPWILQDWEGSSGSFYDQPAAWTGSGGTWLVWDFFLILEGIRVLLCPWLRSIGGIRDSSYSDLSQYETRVMAQMVESTCIAGDLVQSLGWEDPLEKVMATTPVFLPGESPWTAEPGRLHAVHGVKKSQTQLRN